MAVARENPSDRLVTTASGLQVPIGAVAVDASGNAPNIPPARRLRATAYDTDGRRRIGLTKAEARTIQKTVDILNQHGIGVVLACSDRFDGKAHCGGFLTPEGRRGVMADAGFGCTCSRVHFLEV